MTAAPTAGQIRAQVAAIRNKIPGGRVIGIHSAGRWTGEPRIGGDGDTLIVHQCDSPLAVRIALRESAGDDAVHVVMTPLHDRDLGEDVLLRLAKRRLFFLDAWETARALFQAHAVDPRLVRHRWIAEQLTERVPAGGFRPAPGGFLDAETVWPLLLRSGMGLDGERPDLAAILVWSTDPEKVALFRRQPSEFRDAAEEWLADWAGPAARAVLRCAESSAGPDALPIGLAAGVIFHPDAAGQLEKAAGKMEERYLGGAAYDLGTLRRWSAAATEAVRLLADPKLQQRQLLRADEILGEIGAEALAHLSATSPLGFDRRLSAFGDRLTFAIKDATDGALASLESAGRAVFEHDRAAHELRRLERIDMAIRLIRWLAQAREGARRVPGSFEEAAAYHMTEGSFADWARLALRSGDPVRDLSDALGRLFEVVREIRERQARDFAAMLREWTAAGSSGEAVIPVERILAEVVAPLAANAPILVIVLDGMTAAVGHEILSDVLRRDWTLLRPEGGAAAPMIGLAAIPSVTEISRTSLLCGRLCRGTSKDEAAGFSQHPALLAHCRSGSPPILFHKPSLQHGDGASLSPELRDEIGSRTRRIVGVVINAIDDQLLKGEQIDLRWGSEEIKALPALLQGARDAGRLVVLVSDHGHVLDCRTKGQIHEGGERWRVDDGAPAPGEIRVAGSRVAMPESGSLIAPWTEKLRYGVKRNGYHGGLTPQEMVVPIAVLGHAGACPEGWIATRDAAPPWWEGPTVEPQQSPSADLAVGATATMPSRLVFDEVGDEVE